jgi:spore coat polysaccharide biosynthesis protein SpsF
MGNRMATEQDLFWEGQFGSDYTLRNADPGQIPRNVAFFAQALRNCGPIRDCIEFGANVGLNLRALQSLYPQQQQFAVEINHDAAATLARVIPKQNIWRQSIVDFASDRTFDLVFTKGVLIHIAPLVLPAVYAKLYGATRRFLLICEYYNPTPIEVPYRGYTERLFKRDFCGELLDAYSSLSLLDYGFVYSRDPSFPLDDVTWFLMGKRGIS